MTVGGGNSDDVDSVLGKCERDSYQQISIIIYRPKILGEIIPLMKILQQRRYKLDHHDFR